MQSFHLCPILEMEHIHDTVYSLNCNLNASASSGVLNEYKNDIPISELSINDVTR